MATLSLRDRLAILADAAKYDASCASSGGTKRDSRKGGLGSVEGTGICHSYAPDGRCISLLKILLTNHCIYDCLYCVNRVTNDVKRARFTPEEVADLTIGFYKRNYIEGLFLSSGIVKSPDHTMELLVQTARLLRETHHFNGYIHLKTIPDADPRLIEEAGRLADRLSINIELPKEASFGTLAPQKDAGTIRKAMGGLRNKLEEYQSERRTTRHAPRFATGQSTQMIVGADAERDTDILRTSSSLYSSYALKRVYYSAFSPFPGSSSKLPPRKPPLMREHRLYQADWLYRFYGFNLDEILSATDDGMLDLAIDPKTAWALKNRGRFPIDINVADRELLLRVPGLGVKGVERIIASRRHGLLRIEDVSRISRSRKGLMPFITTPDWRPTMTDSAHLPMQMRKPEQLTLF